MRPHPPTAAPRFPPLPRRSSASGPASGCCSPGCCRTAAWCWSSCSRIPCGGARLRPETWSPFLSLAAYSPRPPKTISLCHSVREMYLSESLGLVGRLGCEFEDGEVAVVAGVDGGVFAEEACEDDFVHVHGDFSVLNSRSCSGHTWRSQRVGPAPKCQGVLSWRGPEEVCAALLAAFTNLFWEEPRPRRGGAAEAERRRAAGRRSGPEAVTEHDRECIEEKHG